MIVQKHFLIGERDFIRTYSDQGVFIHGGSPEADYAEAIDPASLGRTYTETDIPIPITDPPDNLDASIDYLVSGHLIAPPTEEADPDYLNEREPEPEYFS